MENQTIDLHNTSSNPMMVTAVVGIILAAIGFGGGMYFQKGQDSLQGLTGQELQKKMASLGLASGSAQGTNNTNGAGPSGFFGGGGFPGGSPGGRGGGGLVTGSIVSANAQGMTVQGANGSTHVVYFTDATTIDKSEAGTTSDLYAGQTVVANGTANSDGSVSATTIQIRPAGTSFTLPNPIQ